MPFLQAGASCFPVDPGQTASVSHPIWRPDLDYETVIISEAPPVYGNARKIDPEQLQPLILVKEGPAGFYVEASAKESDLTLWFPQGTRPVKGAFVVPIDDNFDIRLHSIRRAYNFLHGKPIGQVLRRQKLSTFHRHRYIQMLRIVDGLRAGASKREIASVLFSRDVRSLSAVEWRNASERRHLTRLIAEALEYVEKGYLRILTGSPTKGHLF